MRHFSCVRYFSPKNVYVPLFPPVRNPGYSTEIERQVCNVEAYFSHMTRSWKCLFYHYSLGGAWKLQLVVLQRYCILAVNLKNLWSNSLAVSNRTILGACRSSNDSLVVKEVVESGWHKPKVVRRLWVKLKVSVLQTRCYQRRTGRSDGKTNNRTTNEKQAQIRNTLAHCLHKTSSGVARNLIADGINLN